MRGLRGFVTGIGILIGLYVVVSYPTRIAALLRDISPGLVGRMLSPNVAGIPKKGRGFDEYTELGGSSELRDYVTENDPGLPAEAGKPDIRCTSGFVAAYDTKTRRWHCIEGAPGSDGPTLLPGGGMEFEVPGGPA